MGQSGRGAKGMGLFVLIFIVLLNVLSKGGAVETTVNDGYDVYLERDDFILGLKTSPDNHGVLSSVLELPKFGMNVEGKAMLGQIEQGIFNITIRINIKNIKDQLGNIMKEFLLDLDKSSEKVQLSAKYIDNERGLDEEIDLEIMKIKRSTFDFKLKLSLFSLDFYTGTLDLEADKYSIRIPKQSISPRARQDEYYDVQLTRNSTEIGDCFEIIITDEDPIYFVGRYESGDFEDKIMNLDKTTKTEKYILESNLQDIEIEFIRENEFYEITNQPLKSTISLRVSRSNVTELEFEYRNSRQLSLTFPELVIVKELSSSHSTSLRFPDVDYKKPFEENSILHPLLCVGLSFCTTDLRVDFDSSSVCEDCYNTNFTIFKGNDKFLELKMDMKPREDLFPMELKAKPPRLLKKLFSLNNRPVEVYVELLPEKNGSGDVKLFQYRSQFRRHYKFQYKKSTGQERFSSTIYTRYWRSLQHGEFQLKWSDEWEKGGFPIQLSVVNDDDTKQSLLVQYVLPQHWVDDEDQMEEYYSFWFDLSLDGPKNTSLENMKLELDGSYKQFITDNLRLEDGTREGRWQVALARWNGDLNLDSSLKSRGYYGLIWQRDITRVDLQKLVDTIEIIKL